MMNCLVNNDGATGCAILAKDGAFVSLCACTIRGGSEAGLSAYDDSIVIAAHTTVCQACIRFPGVIEISIVLTVVYRLKACHHCQTHLLPIITQFA
jgi:hypothetical protein